jgi:hypothetical protein
MGYRKNNTYVRSLGRDLHRAAHQVNRIAISPSGDYVVLYAGRSAPNNLDTLESQEAVSTKECVL